MEMRGMSGELLGSIGPDTSIRSPEVWRALAAKPPASLSPAFTVKKRKILSALHPPDEEYTDKSPKGSIDAQIVDLIDEINAYEGLVTTSSCAGRVSVFLEGERKGGKGEGDGQDDRHRDGEEQGRLKAVPGGKGLGGRWLFLSHEPLGSVTGRSFMELFGLFPSSVATSTSALPRLVRFAFEPLILHVLCASLKHAQPLLAAAINAGFRESGVQSLKILDEEETDSQGVMVGIRTTGLGLESVIGVYEESAEGACRALVSEEYLAMMVTVSEERFRVNEKRKDRFRRDLRERMVILEGREHDAKGWEHEDARARRKREEGLRRKEALRQEQEFGIS